MAVPRVQFTIRQMMVLVVVVEAVRRLREYNENACRTEQNARATTIDLIDYEAIKHCSREVEGKDVPSLAEVRCMLAKIPGSMAQAVIEEREHRSNCSHAEPTRRHAPLSSA